MSKDTNQDILKEAKAFVEAMLTSAEHELESEGQVMGMAFMPVRRTTYPSQLSQGLQGRIRHHGEDGEVRQDIIVERETDLNEALLEANLDEAREGTPVFSVPFFDDRDMFSKCIGLASQVLGDVKFICMITDTWTSDKPNDYDAPRKDPNRKEALLGWCIVLDESYNVIGYYQKMTTYSRTKNGFKFDRDDITFEDDLEEIMKQPLVGNIISRIEQHNQFGLLFR